MINYSPQLDFTLSRPPVGLRADHLLKIVENNLSPDTMDIEVATLAFDELGRRNRAMRKVQAARKVFSKSGVQPIP